MVCLLSFSMCLTNYLKPILNNWIALSNCKWIKSFLFLSSFLIAVYWAVILSGFGRAEWFYSHSWRSYINFGLRILLQKLIHSPLIILVSIFRSMSILKESMICLYAGDNRSANDSNSCWFTKLLPDLLNINTSDVEHIEYGRFSDSPLNIISNQIIQEIHIFGVFCKLIMLIEQYIEKHLIEMQSMLSGKSMTLG